MSQQKDPILESAEKELKSENMVAFLGPPFSGRTVVATLFKRAMFHSFLDKYKEFGANVARGNDFLASTEASMLSGEFPTKTPSLETNEIEFEVARTGALGSSIRLRIRDLSGEDYDVLCLGPDIEPKDRIHNIITKGKGKNQPYGPLSFLIFAKMYIIVLDCGEYSDWDKLQLRYSQLLNTLLQFKQAIKEDKDGKITTPIGILLTKTDQLPDTNTVSAEDLIAKKMPQFHHTLKMLHKGKREYFSVYVEPLPNRDNEAGTGDNKVKNPLSYSEDEYVNLILWIIHNIAG